ncbi:ABC-type transport auxiliary lipoprotein family protein [Shimia haliotis]|uniref:Cholesterol transport system auxiliary component n=1 Tax=Shimia haliotis TaxID=1280847 RepID=A0A1I4DHZ8_9RHOB|nr:ABC-type transport auxiliary lipoprotein family protein [Shimia haliotis]SFK92499.1 cholesterol transport system auxiliary component [Shimia haliotis]
MNKSVSLFVVLTALLLGGCAGIGTINRAATPTDLYALTPKSTFDANLPRLRQQIVIEEPTATAAVDTDQIAVHPTPLQVEYLPGVRWVDRAPLIVQALLIESFENSGKVAAVGRSTVGLRPDYTIVTDVREFQAHLPKSEEPDAPLEIHVRLNLKIVDSFSDHIIGSNSFTEVVPTQSDEMLDIVTAFDSALGRAMRDSVEWSVRKIYGHAQANPRPQLR